MGQGTDSCSGWEIEYDEYDQFESDGYSIWTGKNGVRYRLNKMKTKHILNCIDFCQIRADISSFSDDSEKWNQWIDSFQCELSRRHTDKPSLNKIKTVKKEPRGAKQRMKCHCGSEYYARVADLNRGWGLSCSKRCAAIRREFGRPKGKKVSDYE